ncbi:hypothetical protein Bbelb_372220 [Branchiostoma belcheri]|nr:hypothetical protein Bbelb_372220 [Branchiostoma belcheri]
MARKQNNMVRESPSVQSDNAAEVPAKYRRITVPLTRLLVQSGSPGKLDPSYLYCSNDTYMMRKVWKTYRSAVLCGARLRTAVPEDRDVIKWIPASVVLTCAQLSLWLLIALNICGDFMY